MYSVINPYRNKIKKNKYFYILAELPCIPMFFLNKENIVIINVLFFIEM